MYSTCINVILDKQDKIVFTDLDSSLMEQIDYLDEEIVRFIYFGVEGDNCSTGEKVQHLYMFLKQIP
jgi:hypothetical protein